MATDSKARRDKRANRTPAQVATDSKAKRDKRAKRKQEEEDANKCAKKKARLNKDANYAARASKEGKVVLLKKDFHELRRTCKGTLFEPMLFSRDTWYHGTKVPPGAMEKSHDGTTVKIKPLKDININTRKQLSLPGKMNKTIFVTRSIYQAIKHAKLSPHGPRHDDSSIYIYSVTIEDKTGLQAVGLTDSNKWTSNGCTGLWKTPESASIIDVMRMQPGRKGNFSDQDSVIEVSRANGNMTTVLSENLKQGMKCNSDHYHSGLFCMDVDSDDESLGIQAIIMDLPPPPAGDEIIEAVGDLPPPPAGDEIVEVVGDEPFNLVSEILAISTVDEPTNIVIIDFTDLKKSIKDNDWKYEEWKKALRQLDKQLKNGEIQRSACRITNVTQTTSRFNKAFTSYMTKMDYQVESVQNGILSYIKHFSTPNELGEELEGNGLSELSYAEV